MFLLIVFAVLVALLLAAIVRSVFWPLMATIALGLALHSMSTWKVCAVGYCWNEQVASTADQP